MRVRTPRCLILSLSLAAMSPAMAGMFDADALKAVTVLRQETEVRLQKLEQAAQNQLDMANQMESIKGEQAKARGQLEMLTFTSEQIQKRSQDYYVDLDNRLRKLETAIAAMQATLASLQQPAAAQPPAAAAGAVATGSAPAAPAQPATPDPEAETKAFEAGLDLFKGNQFKEAAAAFRAFIGKYPSSAFAARAHYWGGNAHYQLQEWAKAGELYMAIAQKWPNDTKAPDALLQLSEVQGQAGDAKAAHATLESLVARYPDSQAGATAKQRLGKKKS